MVFGCLRKVGNEKISGFVFRVKGLKAPKQINNSTN